jgi:hypothetical protein
VTPPESLTRGGNRGKEEGVTGNEEHPREGKEGDIGINGVFKGERGGSLPCLPPSALTTNFFYIQIQFNVLILEADAYCRSAHTRLRLIDNSKTDINYGFGLLSFQLCCHDGDVFDDVDAIPFCFSASDCKV